jgi:hypothetical protein
MKTLRSIAVLFAMAILFSAVFPAGAIPKDANVNEQSTINVSCTEASSSDSAGTITFVGPTRLWPPNHKYTEIGDIVISATDEDTGSGTNPAADNVAIEVMASHEQFADGEELPGSGNTDEDVKPDFDADMDPVPPDATGIATTNQWQVRAERSGQDQTGREYLFEVMAEFSDSDEDGSSEDVTVCSVEFRVCVPHDMRKSTRAVPCPNPENGSSVQGTVPDSE